MIPWNTSRSLTGLLLAMLPLGIAAQGNWNWANRIAYVGEPPAGTAATAPEQIIALDHDSTGNLYALIYHHGLTEVGGQSNTGDTINPPGLPQSRWYSLAKYDEDGRRIWSFPLASEETRPVEMKTNPSGQTAIVWREVLTSAPPQPNAAPPLPAQVEVCTIRDVNGISTGFSLPDWGNGTVGILTLFGPDGMYQRGRLLTAYGGSNVNPDQYRIYQFNMRLLTVEWAPDGSVLIGGGYQDTLQLGSAVYPMPVYEFMNSSGNLAIRRKRGGFWTRLDPITLDHTHHEQIMPGGLPSSAAHYTEVMDLDTDAAGQVFALSLASGTNFWDGLSASVDTLHSSQPTATEPWILSQYTPAGAASWLKTIVRPRLLYGAFIQQDLAVDQIGDSYVRSFAFNNAPVIDGQPVITPETAYGSVVFIKFSPAGAVLHYVFAGDPGPINASNGGSVTWGAMDIDADNHLYLAGYLQNSRGFRDADGRVVVLTSDGYAVNLQDKYNAFVARYSPEGRLVGIQKGGGFEGNVVPVAIAANKGSQVVIGGHFYDTKARFGDDLLEGAPYANQGTSYAGGFVAHLGSIRVMASIDSLRRQDLNGVPVLDYVKVRSYGTSFGTFCGGDTVVYPFMTLNYRSAGNRFVLEMSDSAGHFGPSPLQLDSITTDRYLDSIVAKIPYGLKSSAYYRFRVVASNNPVLGISERARGHYEPEMNGSIYESQPVPSIQQAGTVLSVACPYSAGCKVYWYQGNYQSFVQVGDLFGGSSSYIPTVPGTYWVEIVGQNLNTCVLRTPIFTYPAATPVDPALSAVLRIYPNPGQDQLIMEVPDLSGRTFRCEWIDIQGRRVLSQQGRIPQAIFDTRNLPAGMYRLLIHADGVWLGAATWVKSGT